MNTINIDSFSAWFSVNTVHGGRLEFVMGHTAERKGRDTGYYFDALESALNKAFRTGSTRLLESNEYGHVMFNIQDLTPDKLLRALAKADKVTQRWINKYRINEMKEN